MDFSFLTYSRAAGSVLVISTLVYIGGLMVLFLRVNFASYLFGDRHEWLEELAEHKTAYRFGFTIELFSDLLTVVGLAMLTVVLWNPGGRTLSALGLLLYMMGALIWTLIMVTSMSASVWAAEETVRRSSVPEAYLPLARLVKELDRLHGALATFSIALYGWAVIRTDMLPVWVGWVTLAWSLAWLALLWRRKENIPVVHHAMPLLIGVMLLVT